VPSPNHLRGRLNGKGVSYETPSEVISSYGTTCIKKEVEK